MKSYYLRQLQQQKGKIVWLASYPKSGNTWFRALLNALLREDVNINNMKTDGIFSNRTLFDQITDIDGRMLTEAEIKKMLSTVFSYHINFSPRLEFMKVHDAYSFDLNNKAIFPTEISHKVIYLVRNPLDVVASFANHIAGSIDDSINLMNNNDCYLAKQAFGININNQFPQYMGSWSNHVKSWTNQKKIPFEIIRYEDMKRAPVKTFSRAIKSIGINAKRKDIINAVELTKFDKLQKMEKKIGFKEKSAASKIFFRSGQTNGWKNELSTEQAKRIIKKHKSVMTKLGYTNPNLQKV